MTAPAGTARSFQPVRRHSPHAGEREYMIWRPIGPSKEAARRFTGALIKAAEQFDDETKAPGKQMGALGMTGIKVLRALCGLVCYRTGRLEPSIAWLQEKTRLARATVVRALARLKRHHFINWLRRSEPTGNDGPGPQVRQVTNAYWFGLRDEALARVKRLLGGPPPTAPAEPPPAPRPRSAGDRAGSRARVEAQLASWRETDGYQKLRAFRAAALAAMSASSESRQNPATEEVKEGE